MHVLVTGASGLIGSHIMIRLLAEGHSVSATDINPLPAVVEAQLEPHRASGRLLSVTTGDLTQPAFVDEVFAAAQARAPLEGVAHIGGVRSPVGLDPRVVHSINVVASYNVLLTAAREGVRRIVQASSCNALGLSWTMPEHWGLDFVPIDESHPMRPEDPYSLSKLACEEQAKAIARYYPGTRIASIRMHFTRSSINETTASVKHTGLWSWSSVDAVLRGCILGLTSEGWEGAEAFHIAASEIFYPAELSGGVELGALELLDKHWKDKVKRVDESWWEGSPRRSFFDTSKAERMLGWQHDL